MWCTTPAPIPPGGSPGRTSRSTVLPIASPGEQRRGLFEASQQQAGMAEANHSLLLRHRAVSPGRACPNLTAGDQLDRQAVGVEQGQHFFVKAAERVAGGDAK